MLFILIAISAVGFCHSLTYPYKSITEATSNYELPDLPFGYEDLEPFIDNVTVQLHHLGHHASYTRKLNAVLEQWKSEDPDSYAASSILHRLKHLDDIPEAYRRGIRNNGGGFVNHNLYWSTMKANKNNETSRPASPLLDDINTSFGSFEEFQNLFTSKALTLFGSGYVWLSQKNPLDEKSGNLVVTTTANQDTPISVGLQPILVLDVWEHAYYMKHQYRRPAHVADWWKVVDWTAVAGLRDWWSAKDQAHEEL